MIVASAISLKRTSDFRLDDCSSGCFAATQCVQMHAFNSSEVQRSQLEAAAARVFKGRFQIGQFDPSAPKTPWDSLTGDAVYSKANQQLALEGAQQSPVRSS